MNNKAVTWRFDILLVMKILSPYIAIMYFFQESHAFSLYNKGLSLQRQGDLPGAEQAFKKILQIDVVDEVQLQNLEKIDETCSKIWKTVMLQRLYWQEDLSLEDQPPAC